MNKLIEKLTEFPESGWCKEFDEDILKYLNEQAKTDILRACKSKGKCGFAWQKYSGTKYHDASINVWAVKGESSKTKYSVEQLLEVIPNKFKSKAKCVSFDTKEWQIPPETFIWNGGRQSGKTAYIHNFMGNLDNYESDAIDYHKMAMDEFYRRNTDLRMMEEKKLMERERHRQELFSSPIWAEDDRITSMGMSLMSGLGKSGTPRKDRFTQQETILVKSKKRKRKLIFS